MNKKTFNCGTQQPGMSDREGASVFYEDGKGKIFRTYSTYGRGQFWVKYHDKYA